MIGLHSFGAIFFALLIGHCLADFPLQGDFLAKAKNRFAPLPGVPWATALWSHAIIHAGFVWAVTGSIWLGLAEMVAHALIDHLKCAGRLGTGGSAFDLDQTLHILCKLAWTAIAVWALHP